MNRDTLHVLASYTAYFLVFAIPVLAFVLSDRFRRAPSPSAYALLFAIGAAIGLVLYIPAISVVAGTALLALLLARLLADRSLVGVSYTRSVDTTRLFPGDSTTLRLELSNNKPLPLAWVSLTDPISLGAVRSSTDLREFLDISAGLVQGDDRVYAMAIRTAVAPFQRLTRSYTVTARQRGVYALGRATIGTGDPFGLFDRFQEIGGRQEIIVYPRLYRPEELGLPFREAMGTLVTRSRLFPDPTLLAGSREYRPGDPLNQIHWKATARTRELQVRQHDASTTAHVMVVLNVNTFGHVWEGIDVTVMEPVIEAAASVSLWSLERGFATGLRSTGVVPTAHTTPRIAPGASPRQAMTILEHLARISFSGRFTAEEILLDEADRLRPGGTILFVTATMTPAIARILRSARLTGRVAVVFCGRAAPVMPELPTYFVRPPHTESNRAAS